MNKIIKIRQKLAAINKIDLLQGVTQLATLNNHSEYLGRNIYTDGALAIFAYSGINVAIIK
ncbi:hypothetical protein PROVRETT_08157 [Providencia rettgeri DSM 1131]|uniref:hypothetical protein n=1 Tax=Providencia rettgeri TaxID=587 RepID=UPI000197C87A|nr:hypothetical protein [Providencia rettgeri]EFE53273.1 hypothetical protein PROVRETT_08157 [Providencia rettgeri DSM 1131]BBV03468.1 hypothetical protein BML2531_12440 [Providencia rettgeri]